MYLCIHVGKYYCITHNRECLPPNWKSVLQWNLLDLQDIDINEWRQVVNEVECPRTVAFSGLSQLNTRHSVKLPLQCHTCEFQLIGDLLLTAVLSWHLWKSCLSLIIIKLLTCNHL